MDLMIEKLLEICPKENIFLEEPMKNHTSFQVGGPADCLVLPRSQEELNKILEAARMAGTPCFVIGNGSNLLVGDRGIRGIVVKTSLLQNVEVQGTQIRAECGVMLSKLACVAAQHGLSGLEFASGIPGTVGGAVMMNAGAYGGEMKQVVVETAYTDEKGNIASLEGQQHEFSYRHSFFTGRSLCILSTTVSLQPGDRTAIEAKMKELNQRRKDKQPLNYPSAGSTFKRPEGHFAGKLIEDAGLKGYRIGDAQVSQKHSGFIINRGAATAEDILKLIEFCQKEVYNKFNILLETEIKMIGEF